MTPEQKATLIQALNEAARDNVNVGAIVGNILQEAFHRHAQAEQDDIIDQCVNQGVVGGDLTREQIEAVNQAVRLRLRDIGLE